MLVALTNGKAGRLKSEIQSGASWRQVFRASEDLLTASVFGRLTYLDGPVLWTILRGAFPELPDYRMVELLDVEFWPRWLEEGEASTVEPDVFLQFQVGDPAVRIDVIVEAKFGTAPAQYADQWRRQWTAYHSAREEEGEDVPRSVYLMAIGGIGARTDLLVERLLRELEQHDIEIRPLAAHWSDLLRSLVEFHEKSIVGRDRRIVEDIIEALGLANYRHAETLNTLPAPEQNWRMESIEALTDYDFRNIR